MEKAVQLQTVSYRKAERCTLPKTLMPRRALFALLLTSCSPTEQVDLRFPARDSDIRSMVVAIQDNSFSITAYDLTDDAPVIRVTAGDDAVRITVLYYRESLADHHWSAGEIRRASPSECTPYEIPQPAGQHEVVAQDGEVGSWTAIEALNEELVDFRYLGPCVCTEFDIQIWETGNEFRNYAVTPIDDQSVLVVSSTPGPENAYIVRKTGITPIDLGIQTKIYSAHNHHGTIWLGGTGGMLYRGTPSSGFVAEVATTTTSVLYKVDGARGDDPFELFFVGLGDDFTIYRFDGTSWTHYRWAANPSDSGHRDDVAYVAPGNAIATFKHQSAVIEFIDGDLSAIPWNYNDQRYSRAIDYVEGFGVIASSYGGNLFLLTSDRSWQQLEGYGPGRGSIRKVHAMPNGFLFAGNDGVLGTYQEPQGMCPFELMEGVVVDIRDIVALGNGYVLAGDLMEDRQGSNQIIYIEPKPQ